MESRRADDASRIEGTAAQWRALGFLALAELLGMTLWFSASAVVPAPERGVGRLAGRLGVADHVGADRVRRGDVPERGSEPARPDQLPAPDRGVLRTGRRGERRVRAPGLGARSRDTVAAADGRLPGGSVPAWNEGGRYVVPTLPRTRHRAARRRADGRIGIPAPGQGGWRHAVGAGRTGLVRAGGDRSRHSPGDLSATGRSESARRDSIREWQPVV